MQCFQRIKLTAGKTPCAQSRHRANQKAGKRRQPKATRRQAVNGKDAGQYNRNFRNGIMCGWHYSAAAVTVSSPNKPASRLMSCELLRDPSWLQPGGAKI